MVVLDIPCCRCGKHVNQNEVRMDPEFKRWVCIECSKKNNNNNKEKETVIGGFDFSKNRKLRPIQQTSNKINTKDTKDIKNMICMRCKFKFKRKINSNTSKICPNCGRDEIREYKEVKNPAESLIKLSLDEKYNY